MRPDARQLDLIAGVSSEDAPSRVLRLGKDEMNLAEFPITLLTDRVAKGQKVIQYQDQIFDEKLGRTLTRKLTISADEAYGLPTAVDDDVILGLIQLTKQGNGFTAREVQFNRLDLIKMLDWPDSGFSYKRLATSLKRWLGVTLVYENAWWDRKQQAWTTRGFHIIDNFELNDGRATTLGDSAPSKVIWNRVVFESFQAGYLKSIDYELYLSLQHPTAKRMYRFLSKRMYHRPDWVFDLRDLAFEHVGLSRNYSTNAGKIKEKLQPAIDELESVGFLLPMDREERFQKEGKAWKIRLVQRTAPPAPTAAAEATAEDAIVSGLMERGVTAVTAADLVRRHPPSAVAAKVEVFDWLVGSKDRRVAKNPAGYLVKSIEDDYAPPRGFVPAAERLIREEARLAAEREAAERQRRQRESEARDRDSRGAALAYWEALDERQRSAIDAATLATADAEQIKLEAGPLRKAAAWARRERYIIGLLGGDAGPAETG